MIIFVEKKSLEEVAFSFVPGKNPPEKVIVAMVKKSFSINDLMNVQTREKGVVLGTFIANTVLWDKFTSDFLKLKMPGIEEYG
jgi:hypothetical protein